MHVDGRDRADPPIRIAPATYLSIEAFKRYRFAGISPRIWVEIVNTIAVASVATAIVLVCGLIVVHAARAYPGRLTAMTARASMLGYAVPGTVLAIGLLVPLGFFDRVLADGVEHATGISPGLLLLGSGAGLVLAYAIRFMTISVGGIEAGFSRIPPSLDHAARMLGRTSSGVFRNVHLPLSRAALASAGLLAFVDCARNCLRRSCCGR